MDFPNFVNEEFQNQNLQPRLLKGYTGIFTTFDFESVILEKIAEIENIWIRLVKNYEWGSNNSLDYEHFAFDTNLEQYPELDKSKQISKAPEHLTESGLTMLFHTWLTSQFEKLLKLIVPPFRANLLYGGRTSKSKTKLRLSPHNHSPHSDFETTRQVCRVYMTEKVKILYDTDIEMLKKYEKDEDYRNMVEMGMVHDSTPLKELKRLVKTTANRLQIMIEDLNEIEKALHFIKNWLVPFSETALSKFYEDLAKLDENEIINEIY